VMLVWTLVPFYWMVATSLKKDKEIYGFEATLIPRQPTLGNYVRLFTTTPFMKYVRNSTIIAVGTTVFSLVFGCLGAYALARLRFPGRGLIARGLVVTYLVPPSLLFIPLFQIIGQLGLINNFWCLVILYPTLAVPFCTWIMIGYFSSIPKELDEAALIDGAGYLQMLWKIFIPVAMPGIIAATIFAFTVAWGAFLYPLAYLYTSNQMVLTVGIISDLIRGDVFQWGKIMAACLLASLPPIIIYAFLMDYYIAGLTAGATKG
jgi:multiple sugar transport system permease protein